MSSPLYKKYGFGRYLILSTSRSRSYRLVGYTVYQSVCRRWEAEESKDYGDLCIYLTGASHGIIWIGRHFYKFYLYRLRPNLAFRLISKIQIYMLRILLIVIFCFVSLPIFSAGEGFIVESIGSSKNIEPRKRLIEEVLSSDQMHFGYRALSIILDTKLIEPRGQMTWKSIRLSPSVSKDAEFIQLLVHEVAHYIDIYSLISVAKNPDPSSHFYEISWEWSKTKKANETIASFISWYAATNQWEDFAESFTFYVFHNDEFAERALKNESLRKKYLFFGEYVFVDGTFLDTDFGIGKVPSYIWDTTKVPVSVKKYLYFLN